MIYLNDVFNISDTELRNYTLALNQPNGEGNDTLISYVSNDVDSYMRDLGWHQYANGHTFRKLDTKYVLQFVQFNSASKWLFVGCYEVTGKIIDNGGNGNYYELMPTPIFDEYKGRLVINYRKVRGWTQVKLDINYIKDKVAIDSILSQPYTGDAFPGFSNVINVPFKKLKINLKNRDWETSLASIDGVYMIYDAKNKQMYVGSAYGGQGILQRWETYIRTNGSGNDVTLNKLISDNIDYAEKNFSFSLLEWSSKYDDDKEKILGWEGKWKDALHPSYNNN